MARKNVEASQPDAAESEQDVVSESEQSNGLTEIIARLEAELSDVKARLAHVEQIAHTDHKPESAALDHITNHVMGHVHEHLRKAMGHSGLPVRGDQ